MAAWLIAALALTLASCEQRGPVASGGEAAQTHSGAAEAKPETVGVRIGGERFEMELALDDDTRVQGLSGRDHIARNGGMLFVFRHASVLAFVMRDCPIPIDVAFLDGAGRVLTIHEMPPEEPRNPEETDFAYNLRLKQYSSRFPAQFAIETAGGRMREVGLKVGDLVSFDTEGLKQRAR